MICIKNNIIPFKGYKAINLFGIIFTRKQLTEKEKNHEKIHSEQMLEVDTLGVGLIALLCLFCNLHLAWCFFGLLTYYMVYCFEYLVIRFFHKKQKDAYHDVSFEEEAYKYDNDLNYIENKRKPFNWIKYIKIKSYTK